MYPSPQNAARSLTHSHPLPVLSRTACSPLPHTYLPPPTPGAVARRAASTADSCAPCTATDHPLSRCRHSPSQLLRSPAVPLTAPPPSPAPPARARAASQSQWYRHEISGTMITIALSNGAGGSCDRGPPGRPLFAHVQHRASAVRRAPASEPPEAAPLIALEASDRGRKPEAQRASRNPPW